MLRVIDNKYNWDDILNHILPHNDVYFKYEYLDIWAKEYGGNVEAILWQENGTTIFLPHIRRNKNDIILGIDYNTEIFDYTTPYGYGGPLIHNPHIRNIKQFSIDYSEYLANKTEFIRFHPTFQNWKHMPNIQQLNDIVVVITDKPHIKKGHRYNIRKSKKKGVKISIIPKPNDKHINKFMELYNQTMSRNNAPRRYYFRKEFIKNHFDALNSFLMEANVDNQVICSNIFILGDDIMHYHLSGSDKDYKDYYPSDLIIWNAIQYAKEKGYKMLMLGGGRGKNDSLYKFKTGFSNVSYPFYITKLNENK